MEATTFNVLVGLAVIVVLGAIFYYKKKRPVTA